MKIHRIGAVKFRIKVPAYLTAKSWVLTWAKGKLQIRVRASSMAEETVIYG